MSLQTIPSAVPSRSTRMITRHRIQTVRFGGGRSVRIREGHQQPDISWQVVWDGLRVAKAAEFNDFFIARNGVDSFTWHPPGAAAAQIFICTEWQVIPINAEFSRIEAQLTQVH